MAIDWRLWISMDIFADAQLLMDTYAFGGIQLTFLGSLHIHANPWISTYERHHPNQSVARGNRRRGEDKFLIWPASALRTHTSQSNKEGWSLP